MKITDNLYIPLQNARTHLNHTRANCKWQQILFIFHIQNDHSTQIAFCPFFSLIGAIFFAKTMPSMEIRYSSTKSHTSRIEVGLKCNGRYLLHVILIFCIFFILSSSLPHTQSANSFSTEKKDKSTQIDYDSIRSNFFFLLKKKLTCFRRHYFLFLHLVFSCIYNEFIFRQFCCSLP